MYHQFAAVSNFIYRTLSKAMLLRALSDIRPHLGPRQRLLGLDYGSKVIGVALSDPGLRIASPIASIVRTKFSADAALLAGLIQKHDVGGLVVGLPRNMDGTQGGSAQAARAFIRQAMQKGLVPDLPVVFWDERLSTAAIERLLISGDMSRKRRGEVIDKMAAAYILQGALDSLGRVLD